MPKDGMYMSGHVEESQPKIPTIRERERPGSDAENTLKYFINDFFFFWYLRVLLSS